MIPLPLWISYGHTVEIQNYKSTLQTELQQSPCLPPIGSEVKPFRFTATDNGTGSLSDYDDAIFTVAQMGIPSVGEITNPTCLLSTGSVALSNLPSGSWTVYASSGGGSIIGSGPTATFSGLPAGSYTFTVEDASGCISDPSGSAAYCSTTANTSRSDVWDLSPIPPALYPPAVLP